MLVLDNITLITPLVKPLLLDNSKDFQKLKE